MMANLIAPVQNLTVNMSTSIDRIVPMRKLCGAKARPRWQRDKATKNFLPSRLAVVLAGQLLFLRLATMCIWKISVKSLKMCSIP